MSYLCLNSFLSIALFYCLLIHKDAAINVHVNALEILVNPNQANLSPTKNGEPDISSISNRIKITMPLHNSGTTGMYSAHVMLDGNQGYMKCLTSAVKDLYDNEVNSLKDIMKLRQSSNSAVASIAKQNIVGFLDGFIVPVIGNKTKKCFCVVTETVKSGRDMLSTIAQSDPDERDEITREVFRQTINALAVVHQIGWSHGDLTSNNIMIALGTPTPEQILQKNVNGLPILKYRGAPQIVRAVLIDFVLGAPPIRAPELKLDVWALGITLYQTVEQSLPDSYSQANSKNWPPKVQKHWNRAINGVIAAMLNPLPKNRLSATQLLTLPWFKGAEDGDKPRPSTNTRPRPPRPLQRS
ncbi:kinase-like domain-containing protein [Syncephalis fuscata]|nr:kinase-like domain-containing protein [Syncephalis fuscata]